MNGWPPGLPSQRIPTDQGSDGAEGMACIQPGFFIAGMTMNGLELAREYYSVCRPRLYETMPQVMDRACAGLCGEGSECFGVDDDLSRDHDFSPAFCLWLPEDVIADNRILIEEAFKSLPKTYGNMRVDFGIAGNARRGPLSIRAYYRFFTGLEQPPANWREWLGLSEERLAAATNGEIFEDNGGFFSAWREKLAYFPGDVRLKKLAARAMQMAQSGQYNLPRCLARGETGAAFLAVAKFAEAATAFVFLANRRYAPYYKWAPKLGGNLPALGSGLRSLLDVIASQPVITGGGAIVEAVENFCSACASWLNQASLSDVRDNWLWAHGPEIIKRVETPEIRSLNLLETGL